MKTKRWAILALVACSLLLLAHDVLAFYNPQTGRWLNRDPINEPGLKVAVNRQERFDRNQEKNLYAFVRNNAVQLYDIDGRNYFPFPGWPLEAYPQRCGTSVTRAIEPEVDPDWWAKLHETISGLFYPHTFVIVADGTRLTHGGTADGENHRTAERRGIYIRKCDSCDKFTQCMKDNWPDDSEYNWYYHNCGYAVATTVSKCGGTILAGASE